jgi:predicted outer membrane repeat protein
MSRFRTYRPRVECLESRLVPTTFTVTNLLDNQPGDPLIGGSLRKQIDRANQHPGPDTIVFKPGMEGTIKLTAGEINIASNLILAGPGAAKITIDGPAASRIFLVDDPATLNVKIRGLELRDGSASVGGAIRSHENLTLVNMVLTGNRGSIGGAVYAEGTLIIQRSSISGNTGHWGGGIYVFDCALTVDRSTIAGNTASARGGGLYLNGGKSTIRNAVVSGNTATTIGGGLYAVDVADLAIVNSTISGNQAGSSGGGLFAKASVTALTIEASTITGNHAVGQGGGLYTEAILTKIAKTKITYNTADSSGAGLSSKGVTEIERCTISGNRSRDGRGGGIRQSGASLTVTSSTVSGNHADAADGGGLAVSNATSTTITASTISGNTALKGGGLFLLVDQVGVFATQIRNSTISGNRAATIGGGFYENNANASFNNCTIAFNRAGMTGGGISSTGGNIVLDRTIVALNAGGAQPDLNSATTNFIVAFSLIGNRDGAVNFPDGEGNILGTGGAEVDPLLAPLAFNGGPTQTHALKKGSPAVNAGHNLGLLEFDQRGTPFKRKSGPFVDIGAFERQ